ncbi:hypothetical protein HPP92_006454 [Vanilla planifolia]|uniref:Holocarboxylase synthetase n=1 Tax=Vanilla planifolia TaxID=51239 RepID=A0A835RJ33_VANPL|nr:hypothetical protein HPP92_006454 [Vanilla planifolia]
MSRKRKSGATPLDEVERTLYSSFCNAANSLSQLYTQAMNHQKVAFQAGERHGMEKLYQWILKQHEDGSRVTAADIVTHIENCINYGGDATSMSPRVQHQLPQTITNSSTPAPLGSLGPLTHLVISRNSHTEQAKETMFSNALSSPVAGAFSLITNLLGTMLPYCCTAKCL